MSDRTPFNRLLGERVRRLVEKDGRSMEAISLAIGMGAHTVSRTCPRNISMLEEEAATLRSIIRNALPYVPGQYAQMRMVMEQALREEGEQ